MAQHTPIIRIYKYKPNAHRVPIGEQIETHRIVDVICRHGSWSSIGSASFSPHSKLVLGVLLKGFASLKSSSLNSQLIYSCITQFPTIYILWMVPIISVAHCSRSQDIALFKFQLSYHSNPLQDTCPITSAVLGHLIRTRVPLMFLNWDRKSYQLCEKCATLYNNTFNNHTIVLTS